jgi:uncharacterized protein with PQ loop repeat
MSRHATHHFHQQRKKVKKQKVIRGPIDYFVYFFMFTAPLFELPQAFSIYTAKNAHSVSLATWSLFFMASLAWLVYGLRQRLQAVVAIHVLYMSIEATVVVGILHYG